MNFEHIIGIAVGALLLIVAAILCFSLIRRRRSRNKGREISLD